MGLKIFGSNLDPFLHSGLSIATLQDSGNADSEIERFMKSVMGFDNILAPSLRKVPDKPSLPDSLIVYNFPRIFIIWLS